MSPAPELILWYVICHENATNFVVHNTSSVSVSDFKQQFYLEG